MVFCRASKMLQSQLRIVQSTPQFCIVQSTPLVQTSSRLQSQLRIVQPTLVAAPHSPDNNSSPNSLQASQLQSQLRIVQTTNLVPAPYSRANSSCHNAPNSRANSSNHSSVQSSQLHVSQHSVQSSQLRQSTELQVRQQLQLPVRCYPSAPIPLAVLSILSSNPRLLVKRIICWPIVKDTLHVDQLISSVMETEVSSDA